MIAPQAESRSTSETLPAACFTAEGSAENAAKLHQSYRRHMRGHFLAAIDSAGKGLQLDVAHIRRMIERLDPVERYSPAAYSLMTQLPRALGSGNITSVVDSLQAIRLGSSDELRAPLFRVESCLTEPWEQPFVQQARHEPAEGHEEEIRIVRPILELDPSRLFTPVYTALEHLKQVDPGLAAEFDEYVTRVKLFTGRGFLGFSSPAAFGAIYMRLPEANPVEYFLEHLVHELSLLTLNVLMAHDPLLKNPDERHTSPLRESERPLFQVLHATFALNRNVRVTRRLIAAGAELNCTEQLPEFESKYAAGWRVLEEQAEFTERGRELIASFEPCAS